MPEKKEWRGIQINHCQFQGTIVANPVFNGDYAFLTLRTINVQRDPNGQYVEVDQEVPLMVEPDSPALKVTRTNIKAGRRLMAWCSYKTWVTGGVTNHAFSVKRFDLGGKPFEDQQGHATPPLSS